MRAQGGRPVESCRDRRRERRAASQKVRAAADVREKRVTASTIGLTALWTTASGSFEPGASSMRWLKSGTAKVFRSFGET